jgi:hypothetical protein
MGIITFNIDAFVNSPPNAIGATTITVAHGATYVFTQANFTTQTSPPYSDPDGDPVGGLQVKSLPATGELQYNGVPVTDEQEISWIGINQGLFTYVADTLTDPAHTDPWSFDLKDTGSDTYSGLATGIITMDVQSYQNQPPTTGNNTLSGLAHASETTITTANLTTGTTPAYNDPEGDSPLLLRVNTLPANGNLLLNGAPVVAGQIISFTDITAGLFTYKAALNVYNARNVTFDFDIQDTGSGQWSS